MKKTFAFCSTLLLVAAAPALAERDVQAEAGVASAAELGPPASDAAGAELLGRIEAKWAPVMRKLKGWTDASFRQFRGYRNYPVSVLEEALAAETFERMQSTLHAYAELRARDTTAKAHSARKEYPLDATRPEHAANELLVEAKALATKSLGDDARDLVFVPIAPCTVWDTRFASADPFKGAIGNGVTRRFYSHAQGGGTDFTVSGGNPACAEANEIFIGGSPYAVMMTVYVNDPAGNGWLTFYRDGDPDPSQATISVYYSPGPTRTQTVIAKSSRGYGTGTYDVSVTGRFSTAHASASVVGYFIKPGATPLQCAQPMSIGPNIAWPSGEQRTLIAAACPAGYSLVSSGCDYNGIPPNGLLLQEHRNHACRWLNATGITLTTGDLEVTATCCRVPGR